MAPLTQKWKRTEVIVFVIFVVVSLAAWAVWMIRWKAQVALRDELNALYAIAGGGDLASVRRLAEYPSPEAIQLIERLAQNRNAFSDSRVEAINVLGARPPIDSKTLAPLLWIDQPFVVRRAVARVFKQRGCDEGCISATLTALHAIWGGQPTVEVRLSAQIPSPTLHDQEDLVYLHKQTEEDYFVLLNSSACLARKTLQTIYGSDSAFVVDIQKKVAPC